MSAVPVRPEHPWLLPATLTADPSTAAGRRPRRSTRDWVVDTLCFLIAAGFAIIAFWDVLRPQPTLVADRVDSELALVIDMVVTTALCLALWVRRRWPVALTLITLPVAVVSTPSAFAIMIIVFTVVVHRPLTISGPLVVAQLGAGVLYEHLHADPADGPLVGMVLTVVLTGSVLAWGMFVRARRQLVHSWRDRAIRAETEQRLRVEAARRMERTRIAREMHDVLAHRISLLSLHAGALEFRPDASSEEIARAAGVIRTNAHQALEELREVISVLREDPPALDEELDRTPLSAGCGSDASARVRFKYGPDPPYPPVTPPTAGDPASPTAAGPAPGAPERPQPTLADLPDLVAESRGAGMRVELRTELTGAENVPVGMGRGAYRIVQEGLTNARKHAPDTAVTVTARGRPGLGLTVEVRNRWPVREPTEPRVPGTGTGLVGLAERAALLGGWLEHGRTDAGDFRLTAWLPWPS
ncbi:histidine kinase [Plantactinospora sp. B5E13]|uniref:sensor histidine kinase n=1 Tax=Plantactinospora sp. B5E13 TaxID=3153758 RepID=UPI00325CB055